MNRRHRRTLESIFARPTSGNVAWRDALALLKALGADIDESRAGSRVGILLHGIPVVMHKPHPSPMLDKGAVVALREYLEQCGILPDEEE